MKTILQKLGMLIAVLCTFLSSYAYDFEVDGIYYSVISRQDMTCELAHGDIKYRGNMVILSEVSYDNSLFSVIAIGDKAFYECNDLISVTIGNSVIKIGSDAFRKCKSLISVTIPDSVTEIGSDAFHSCTSLTSITIPNSVTEIGEGAFRTCLYYRAASSFHAEHT